MSRPSPGDRSQASGAAAGTPTAAPVRGWLLAFLAGLAPLVAGTITELTTWLAIARPDKPWWTGIGDLGFSYSSLAAVDPDAGPWLQLTGSVGGVNIVAAAVGVMVVARFGLREGHRWAWWFLAFSLAWVGIHDAIMATRHFVATGQPVMLLPYTYCALLAGGLIATRRVIAARPPRRVTNWSG